MGNKLVLKIALADIYGYGIKVEDVYNFIESNAQNVETYELAPQKAMKAAIDYVIILGATGSVASIASLLWMAYKKFIAPRKHSKDDRGGIYIHIDSEKGDKIDFWIGNEYKDRDTFITIFNRKVSKFRNTKRARQIYSETKIEIDSSGKWILRKHKDVKNP